MALKERDVIEWLVRYTVQTTKLKAHEIDITEPFSNFGLSSLDAIELISQFNKAFGTEHSATALFDNPDIKSLSAYFCGLSRQSLNNKFEKHSTSEPIAVIGIGCRFPGSEGPEEFFKNLLKGRSEIRKAPLSRFGLSEKQAPWGGYIDNIESFDSSFFGIFPEEAKHMDPHQKILLEASWEALENAGIPPKSLSGSRTGVFVGISNTDFALRKNALHSKPSVYDGTGSSHSISANRISYLYNFKGPSIAIDTACSSSLVAIHQAALSLKHFESDLALCGGVNVILGTEVTEAFTQAGMLAPDGQCKTFSKEANGYVRGEGVGLLVLKRLSDAKKEGDNILALIRGSAINQDGKTNGMTAPNGFAQQEVIQQALVDAEVQTEEVDYIEAHGTGTALGDPIEYHALKDIFLKKKENSVGLGSVKTNIGHLESAAGVAGVIKVIMSLQKQMIPQHLNFTDLNPKINSKNSPLKIILENKNWPIGNKSRIAGVSSFGFGGTNSHVILSDYVDAENKVADFGTQPDVPYHFLPLSASSEIGLKQLAQRYINLIDESDLSLVEICRAAMTQRSFLKYRLGVVGESVKSVRQSLQDFVSDRPNDDYRFGKTLKKAFKDIAFLYTGQGSQSPHMGKELYERNTTFRRTFNQVIEIAQSSFKEDLFEILFGDSPEKSAKIFDTDIGQIALLAYELALTELWKELGVTPKVIVGHSLGEIIGCSAFGMLSIKDAVQLVVSRGQAMQKSEVGRMVLVYASSRHVAEVIKPFEKDVSIAAHNGPIMTLISGRVEAVKKLEKLFSDSGTKTRSLKVRQGFHSPLMDPVLDEFTHSIENLKYLLPTVPVISCLTGKGLEEKQLNAEFWKAHLRQPTNFLKALTKAAESEVDFFVEIGPHPTLIQLGRSILPPSSTLWLSSASRTGSDYKEFFNAVSGLWVKGVDLNLHLVEPTAGRRNVKIPQTPFDRKASWLFPIFHASLPNDLSKGDRSMSTQKKTRQVILEELVEVMAQEIDLDKNEIDVKEPLIDMGADSLVLMKCLDRINETYHVEIGVADVFQDISNLELMAEYVEENGRWKSESPKIQESSVNSFQQTETSNYQTGQNTSLAPSISFPPEVFTITNPSSEVTQLIQSQLHVMTLQLQALGQKSSVKSGTIPSERSQSISPVPAKNSTSGSKGVLGSFVNTRKSATEKIDGQAKQQYIERLIKEFSQKTAQSKQLAQNYRVALADNRVSAGFRPNLKEMVYPIAFDQAEGSRFKDIDGNEYIDFSMGFGVNLFGHSPSFIQKALKKQLDKGIAVGPQSSLAGEVAEMICEMTGLERAAFVNSGTEAIMTAIRLARAATQRQIVVIFEGSYHGHSDVVLGRTDSRGQTIPVAPGIPESLTEDLVVLEYDCEDSIQWIQDNATQLAAVLVESVQSRYPETQPQEFLKKIREITEQSNTAFIWDEVITGFRIAPGGAQQHFGIQADLATYGKVIGGGLPIGVVAGNSKYLDYIDGGNWSFGNNTMPLSPITFFAGTFCKHPLAMTAAKETLVKLKSEGDDLLHRLNERTNQLTAELNQFFMSLKTPIQVVNFGSLFRFKFTGNMDWLFFALNNKGFYIWEGRNMFLSTAHSEKDIREFIEAIKNTVTELISIGYIPGDTESNTIPKLDTQIEQSTKLIGTEKMILPQERFVELHQKGSLGQSACNISLALSLKGDIDIYKLKSAIVQSMEQHESLNAKYDIANKQVEFYSNPKHDVTVVDFSSMSVPADSLNAWLIDVGNQPLNLSEQCVKVSILQLGENEVVVSFIGHHVAVDGLSIAMLTDEIAKRYSQLTLGKSKKIPSSSSYQIYLQDYEERLQRLNESEEYWEKKASQLISPFELPVRNKTADLKGGRVSLFINENDYKQIRNYGYRNNSTLMMTLMGSLTLAAKDLYNEEALVVGVPVMGHISIKDYMVGSCSNMVPLQCQLQGRTQLSDLTDDLKKETLEVFNQTDYPIQWVAKKAGHTLFNISLNVEPISDLPKFGNLNAELIIHPIGASEYPIILNAMKQNGGLRIEMDYQEKYFDSDSANKFLQTFSKKIIEQTRSN
ncbi:MAG: aminotransferase class III-fold pyridoxal phosphate-dependent enzyme [Bdellovibrionales bacterium]|nr:aminotransferase class III-fold pyridoxal phosphate-dependent enzyme [Bdellovibrionales bacterium]